MKIVKLIESPFKNKRFRVYLDNNKHYDFGLKNGSTYLDHHDKIKRQNYRKRHYNSVKEKPFIENLIPSPSLFSYYLCWGESTSLDQNVKALNKLLKTKDE
jgi:hypothetical protein